MKKYTHTSDYFYGNKISNYGLENGYIDYSTLAKSFNAVLCNDITKLFYGDINAQFNEPELINGVDYNDEYDEYIEIFQYYIIDENGANILQELTDEIVYYLPVLDMYIWGVTHYGAAWNYVLTDIEIKK